MIVPRVCASLLLLTLAAAQEPAAPPPPEPAPAPAPGAPATLTIRGTVLDAAGEPLAKAGVSVGFAHELTTAAVLARPGAACGADGTFALTIPAADADLRRAIELVVAAPGKVGVRVPHLLAQLRASEHAGVPFDLGEIRLPDGFTLSGRVRGSDGKGLRGALVRATDCLARGWEPAFGAAAITDEHGVFVLPGVFGEAMALEFTAEGYFEHRIPWVDLAQPLDLQLTASGFVEGIVRGADGEPATGLAQLQYEFPEVASAPVALERGRFRLSVAADCRLRVVAWDERSGRSGHGTVLDGPARDVTVALGVVGASTFVVRAVDADSGEVVAPLRAVTVWFQGADEHTLRAMLEWRLPAAAADGVVHDEADRFGNTGENGHVYVVAEGYAPHFAAVQWRQRDGYVARLVRESRLEGRVVDAATRAPLAGVPVTCVRAGVEADRWQHWPPVPVLTAADGTFVVAGLAAGSYELRARRANGTAAVSERVLLRRGAVDDGIELALPAGASVRGAVRGVLPRSAAIAGAAGAERHPVLAPRGVLAAAHVDGAVPVAGGSFHLPHRAPGDEPLALIVPMPPRHGAALRVPLPAVTLATEDVAVAVDAALHRPGTITGAVTIAGAKLPYGRLAVVSVSLRAVDAWSPDDHVAARRWAPVRSDGTYVLPAAPGEYSLEVVDVATGVTFLRDGEPFAVAPGGRTVRDVRVEVAELRVRLTSAGPRLGAERLEVSAGGAQRHDGTTLFGGGWRGAPGVDIAHLRPGDEVTVLAPPGDLMLRVGVGAAAGDTGFSWGQEPAAETAATAVLGEVGRVTLELPLPGAADAR